ncbi:MAG: hypothetical protein H6727_18755, partial [Myxococcales bacterium]|nr:hypothetical protein [Myxococcales bacterium]
MTLSALMLSWTLIAPQAALPANHLRLENPSSTAHVQQAKQVRVAGRRYRRPSRRAVRRAVRRANRRAVRRAVSRSNYRRAVRRANRRAARRAVR